MISKKLIAAKNFNSQEIVRQNKGFVLVSSLALFPCVLALIAAVYLFSGFLTHDQQLKKICRETLLSLQEKESQLIDQLLLLNSQALLLKAKALQHKIGIAKAVAAGRPEVAFYHGIQLKEVTVKRQRLEKLQETLLRVSKYQTLSKIMQLRSRLNLLQKSFHNGGFYESFLFFNPQKSHALAVKPLFRDLAPPYELKKNFRLEQAVSISWKLVLRNGPLLKERLPFHFQWKRSCGVTLEQKKKGNQWQKIILTDKYFWK